MSELHQASERRLSVYREYSLQAEKVMASQTPTPTQQENDLAMMGMAHPDDKETDTGPSMPPVAEQQAKLAEAEAGPRERAGSRQPQAPTAREPARPTPPAPSVPRSSG